MPQSIDFFEKVYALVKQIPYGRVSTYGAIAKKLSMPSASRMIGWALNTSHKREGVPAHRVVNRKGLLTGKNHFASPTLMQELLENENIKISNNTVVNFEELFWDDFK